MNASNEKHPWERFAFCPACGIAASGPPKVCFTCDACGFWYYFNPATAVAAFVTHKDSGDIVMFRRNRDPHRMKLGLPGGFVDLGESLDQALRREVREETGLSIERFKYLSSHPNHYDYRGMRYVVTDAFFSVKVPSLDNLVRQESEVAEFLVVDPATVDPREMAFESNRQALADFLRHRAAGEC